MNSDTSPHTGAVYHIVPANLYGTILYPLNQLTERYPDIAAYHHKKYQGRESLYDRVIPQLQCKWNDVLQFSPVHPTAIRHALQAAGHARPSRRWFVIDPGVFSPATTIIYHPGERPEEEHYLPYAPDTLAALHQLPAVQARYYHTVPPGTAVFLFGLTPHLLFRGTLDISNTSVIEV